MSVLYSVARGWVIRGWVGGGISTELWSMGLCCAQGMVAVKEPAFSKQALSNSVCWCVSKPIPCCLLVCETTSMYVLVCMKPPQHHVWCVKPCVGCACWCV